MINTKQLPTPEDRYPIRRALLSVYDKEGLVEFAQHLVRHGVTLVSTGGTARTLQEAGLEVTEVASLTGFPEILDGRVKTLHPAVHGGLLARRNDQDDLSALSELGVEPIDLVVVNLYPFHDVAARPSVSDAEAIENIDIGGPTMIRAAAKNFFFVAAVTDPEQYTAVASELDDTGGSLTMATRRILARQAFEHTAVYDRAIAGYFAARSEEADEADLPARLSLKLSRAQSLRYGENPHQRAAMYGNADTFYEKLHGKDLSFNNIIDLSAAFFLIDEYAEADPTCAILKHTNPCGVASADSLLAAYRAGWRDPDAIRAMCQAETLCSFFMSSRAGARPMPSRSNHSSACASVKSSSSPWLQPSRAR